VCGPHLDTELVAFIDESAHLVRRHSGRKAASGGVPFGPGLGFSPGPSHPGFTINHLARVRNGPNSLFDPAQALRQHGFNFSHFFQ
jgi:hypothetical protein